MIYWFHPQLASGSYHCGKNCATCPYISDGLTNYTFFSTGETRSIKSNLTCKAKNLIYMIQCNRCNLQYIGETKRRLKDRFNEHRRTIDNPNTKSKPTTAAEHFLTAPNHTANDMQLIPIEKVFSNRDSARKAREAFLISKGRTLLPHGLTRDDPYQLFLLLFIYVVCLNDASPVFHNSLPNYLSDKLEGLQRPEHYKNCLAACHLS